MTMQYNCLRNVWKWTFKVWERWYPAHFTKIVSYTWLRWFLKRTLESKCVLTQDFEEDKISEWDGEIKIWEGNKTKDLMKKWEEFKDGRTPFENGIFM